MPGLREPGIARVRRWCQQRVPGHARGRGRVDCDVGLRHLTIVECRPPWRQGGRQRMDAVPCRPAPLHPGHQDWVLYWRDRHLRFHLYDQLEPSPDSGDLLRKTGRDLIAIFWG